MMFMNNIIEKNNKKQFQFFPLRTDFNLKYIPIDTKIIIELSDITNKNNYLKNIKDTKYEIWNKYFNMEHKIFKNKLNKYTFNYIIYTDCIGVSVNFIELNKLKKQNITKEKMKEGRKNAKQNKNNIKSKLIKEEENIKFKEKKIKNKKEYIEKIKNNTIVIKKEFEYLEKISDEEINKINNYIVIDPGKKAIFKMMNKDNKILSYTTKQRKFEIKTIKFKKQINKYKNKTNIIELEKKLVTTCAKTIDFNKFIEYIQIKQNIYEEMQILYEKSKCRIF